jgi:hypothetical protein
MPVDPDWIDPELLIQEIYFLDGLPKNRSVDWFDSNDVEINKPSKPPYSIPNPEYNKHKKDYLIYMLDFKIKREYIKGLEKAIELIKLNPFRYGDMILPDSYILAHNEIKELIEKEITRKVIEWHEESIKQL